MEPLEEATNPGPGTLRVAMTADDVRKQMAAQLDGWNGYVGASNHMGSRFCQDRTLMDAVMAELGSRGLLWLDSRTTAATQGVAAAGAAGVPCLSRDVFLDHADSAEGVRTQLVELEAVCRRKRRAIAVCHPRESTIDVLDWWLSTLEEKRLSLVPISALVR